MPAIFLKRARQKPSRSDGARILLERRWPAGLGKQSARVHAWLRELAPAPELRRWFAAHPEKWLLFRKRYLAHLSEPARAAELEQLYGLAEARPRLTLLHNEKQAEHSAAMILKQLLEGMRKPPASSGPARGASGGGVRASRRGGRRP
jgi:uncharacterized protein YeaO (DUF488 family)